MPQQQVHAKVSQPGRDAASHTAADDDVDQAVAATAARAQELADHTDEFLDEIDACLEENVLEVLVGYVQRGGQ